MIIDVVIDVDVVVVIVIVDAAIAAVPANAAAVADPAQQQINQRVGTPLLQRAFITRFGDRGHRGQHLINRLRIHGRHQRTHRADPVQIRTDGDISVRQGSAQALLCLIGLDTGDELVQPPPQQFRRLTDRHVHHNTVQQLFRSITHQEPQGSVDSSGLFLIDIAGDPGVPCVRRLRPQPAGNAQHLSYRRFRFPHRRADLHRTELPRPVPRIEPRRFQLRDEPPIALRAERGKLQHQLCATRLRSCETPLCRTQLIDELRRSGGLQVGRFPHAKDATTPPRQSPVREWQGPPVASARGSTDALERQCQTRSAPLGPRQTARPRSARTRTRPPDD